MFIKNKTFLVKALECNLPQVWIHWQALVSVSYYVKQSNIIALSMDIQHTQCYLSTLGTLINWTVAASLIFSKCSKIFGAWNECTKFHVKNSIIRSQWF